MHTITFLAHSCLLHLHTYYYYYYYFIIIIIIIDVVL